MPLFAERAFLLRMDGFAVNGRIDAIYGEPDGPWEVVDWKTGRVMDADDPLAALQLDVYGLACVEIWDKRPEDVTLTYFYLGAGEERAKPMDDPAKVRARVQELLGGVSQASYEPIPGPACRHCDFKAFCPEGQAWLASDT